MRKLKYIMHVSLDGFYAGPTGEMQWIHMDNEIGKYVHQVIAPCDAVVYGRVTYELMKAFWPTAEQDHGAETGSHIAEHARWVNPVEKIVFSRTLTDASWENTKIIKEDIAKEMIRLKQKPGKDMVLLGSASIAQLLMTHGLIDEYWLTINPVALGAGKQLFKQRLNLKLVSTTAFASGAIGTHYVPA